MTSNAERNSDKSVGYCKPPVHTRFKKGVSGNPKGRPKKTPITANAAKLFNDIDNEEVVVVRAEKRQRMTKAEANFRQLAARAIKGDLSCAMMIVKMAERYFAQDVYQTVAPEFISESEAVGRYGKRWPDYARYLDTARE